MLLYLLLGFSDDFWKGCLLFGDSVVILFVCCVAVVGFFCFLFLFDFVFCISCWIFGFLGCCCFSFSFYFGREGFGFCGIVCLLLFCFVLLFWDRWFFGGVGVVVGLGFFVCVLGGEGVDCFFGFYFGFLFQYFFFWYELKVRSCSI